MINKAILIGRLTRDPELRYTSSGSAVASFTLAVNRQFTNQQGEREADFINCVIWRKPAENFANFTHKGSLVGIEGRIQTRSYDNQQGQRVYVTEIVVDNFSLLESRSQSEQYRQQHPSAPSAGFNANPMPDAQMQNPYGAGLVDTPNFGTESPAMGNTPDPFTDNGQKIDISDDDLPF